MSIGTYEDAKLIGESLADVLERISPTYKKHILIGFILLKFLFYYYLYTTM